MGQDGSSDLRLPISPLMDERFHEARQRHRQPKKEPSASKLTPLQQAVRKNIYANALATPVRKCRLTGVALPRFFLLGFHAIVNHKTGVPWYMPRGITNNEPMREDIEEQDMSSPEDTPYMSLEVDEATRQIGDSETESKTTENSSSCTGMNDPELALEHKRTTTDASYRSTTFPPSTAKIGGGTYLLRSYQALDSLRIKSAKSSKGVASLLFLTQNIRNSPFALDTFNSARFRPDMSDFVLTLKRRRVFDALVLATRKFKGYISNFNPTRSLKTSQVAAVILIGTPSNKDCDYESVTEQEFRAYMKNTEKDVPVFDLRILLGGEMLQLLKSSDDKRWNTEVLTIKNRNYSQYLLSRLWELEGYLTPLSS